MMHIIKGCIVSNIKSVDNPSMISWNSKGDLVGVNSKNKFINIFDHPKSNKMIFNQNINDSVDSPKFG